MKFKKIIFEGPDRVGKTTQINLLKNTLSIKNEKYFTINFGSYKNNDILNFSKDLYHQAFYNFIQQSNFNIIFDRLHGGEYVYGQIYRDYIASYIFDLEREFNTDDVALLVFIDNPKNLISREDGLSFSTDLELKTLEVEYFKEFYNKSKIKKKMLIDLREISGDSSLSILNIQKQINNFLEV